MFKTAGAILEDFRKLVREATAASDFLVQGLDDAASHRDALTRLTVGFRRLVPIRAGALHAGRGLLHEAAVVQANEVSSFLTTLACAKRLQPYLTEVPTCPWYSIDRNIIIDDLARRLRSANPADLPGLISSVFLVLPDIPDEEPEWLEVLERVSVAPRRQDIEYLLNAVEAAVPASLRRVQPGGEPLALGVRSNDAGALPIAPQFLRRQFSEISEMWHADIATANGRLNQGQLDLPPPEAVREALAIGLDRARILEPGSSFSAQQSWAAIMSSLDVQGTRGPYWFLVRRTDDLGQLNARMRTVVDDMGINAQRVEEFFYGLEALRNRTVLNRDDRVFGALVADLDRANEDRPRLQNAELRNRGQARSLPTALRIQLSEVVDGGESVSSLVMDLLDGNYPAEALRYWLRLLADVATEADDLPAMVAILGSDTSPAHTAARKALRRIDFKLYGPPVQAN
jgi:hypothetical protein